MTSETEFRDATERDQKLPQRPGNQDQRALSSLYKQATEGDVRGKRPGILDLRGRAKYDAWKAIRGKSAEDAMAEYVALVERLEETPDELGDGRPAGSPTVTRR